MQVRSLVPDHNLALSPFLPSSVEEDENGLESNDDGLNSGQADSNGSKIHFKPTHTVFTPRLTDSSSLQYRKPDDRVQSLAPPTSVSSVVNPNYDDFLRRVSVVLYQHLRRCEKRFHEQQAALININAAKNEGRFLEDSPQTDALNTARKEALASCGSSSSSQTIDNRYRASWSNDQNLSSFKLNDIPIDELFREEHFVTPQYRYKFIRHPRLHPLTTYLMEKVTSKAHVPNVEEIFRFCQHLFQKAQLSPECTIVCLIYIERLMEQADVPLLAATWKPIVLCGLLLASKVWQDLSSWNVEFNCIYPQYPLTCINRLERLFLNQIQWDLYVSATVYAKYYFALRSLSEKKDFRRRYNYTMQVHPPNSRRLEERSAAVRNELYSKSL
ncbi:unnamed protein product [Albugo candida]|nr:unnamed protein product [Albugo candida]|eukprot:CCI49763.1 unnamed protein product [Albugo candida]